MTSKQIGILVLLGAIWGASFIFIRIAVEYFGPVFMMMIRVSTAGLILYGVARLNRTPLKLREHWRKFLVLGILNCAIPFTLIAFSEQTLSGSLAAILNSTTPLFTVFIASIFIGDKLTMQKIAGAVIGIIGVSFTVGGSPIEMNQAFIIAVMASLGGALSYGFATVYAKREFVGLSSMNMSVGQLMGASMVMIPLSVTAVPSQFPPTNAIIALLALATISTAFAYQMYFYLITTVGPTKTSTVTLLVPVSGVIWGAILLNEALSAGMLIGLVLILSSVILITGFQPQSMLKLKRAEA